MASEEKNDSSDKPSWFCPYKIPSEFTGSVQPLVCMAGLDTKTNSVHRGIWDMVHLKPSTKDFQPTYIRVPLNHKFSAKKQKIEQIESYVPRGIIKSNWLNKHLQLIPSVVVTFFDMNWTDPYWNDKKNECAQRVRRLKTDLQAHGTQILVMLIKTADAGEDNFSTDRASALCAAADIPPKALYILSHTHSERIQACIQRLEIGMKEASKVYYSGRIRRVKNWKDRTTDLPLLTRYNFKTGFFQEIRRDYVSALSHYHAAHDTLLSIKVTGSNIQQIKTVAGWIIYRICRLNFLKMDYKESQNQFDKHIRALRKIEGNKELKFEHLAWLETQYSYFGELLRHYFRLGGTTLDPVTYFLVAVDYSEKRSAHCKDVLESQKIKWPEELNDYLKDCNVEYVGQRPWRYDSFGPDSVFVTEDEATIRALKYLELQHKHSDDKITHLGVASDFCRDLQRTRTRCQLMMMMGVEFFTKTEYQKCIMLMTHVLREFGREKCNRLLFLVADYGLKAASCEGDVPAYLSFLVFLLKRDFDGLVPDSRRELLWSNLCSVLDKKIPVPDPGSVIKETNWETALAAPFVSYVGVHTGCIVDALFYFPSDTYRASTKAEVRVLLINRTDLSVPVSKCGVAISVADYNCDTVVNTTLLPQQSLELSLFFTPLMKDTGKIIQIHIGYIDIGTPEASIILHYSARMGISPYLWHDGKKDITKQIIAKIEPTIPLLRPKVTRDDPMLTNEWHKMLVSWTNTDLLPYSKIHLTFLVATPYPREVTLTTDPTRLEKYGHLTHVVEKDELEPNASIDTVVYIKCLNRKGNELQLITKAKYTDSFRQTVTHELVEPMEIIKPFEITQKMVNLQTDDVGNVLSNEEFVSIMLIKNLAKCPLQIISGKIIPTSVAYQYGEFTSAAQVTDLTLKGGEVTQLMTNLTQGYPTNDSVGDLEICWKRENATVPWCTSIIHLNAIIPSVDSVFVVGIHSNKGKGELRQPMCVKYAIHNRTQSTYHAWVSLDSTDCFMNAGPKKTVFSIPPLEFFEIKYMLFPLKTGLLKTPRVLIERITQAGEIGPGGEGPSVVHKNVVKYIFVSRPSSSTEPASSSR